VQIHRFQGIITRVGKETIAALLLVVPSLMAADYFPPGDAKGGWRTLTDARKIHKLAGMDLAKLDEAFRFDQGTTQHGGMLVVRHGWLVYEKYFGRGNREANPDMASCGKAFTSIAVGIMLDEKRELIPNGLDEKVFTPQYMPADIFPLEDPAKAEIRLGQLLAMSAGIRGTNPGYVKGEKVTLDPPAVDGPIATTDAVALHQPLWTKPGEGYSYATSSPHLASIVLRRLVGMEMQEYMEQKLAKPMEWGRWDYCLHRPGLAMDHTPGGGSIALRATDALRFAYLLLHEGRWGKQQIVTAEYVRKCAKPSPYNPHYPFSLQFEVNEDGHVAGAPRDAFWKSGAGGFSIYAVPSLDLAIYKMGGNDRAYDPSLTGLPLLYKYDGSRDGWTASGPGGDAGVRKLLETIVAAVDQ
jgi:CubicO group peptidase (beta-lactamase class C family)